MDESNRGKLTFGLALLLTGILLFLQLDPNTNAGFGMLWPLYPVLFGVMGLFNKNGRAFSLILLLVGVFFLLRNLNVLPHISSMYIWPSIIVLIALVAIFSAFGGRKHHHYSTADGDRYSALFGETKETVKDQDVKKISVSAVFGGVELDLTQADIQGEGALIDVFVLFGSADIIAPDTWAVENKISSVFGGVENKTRADSQQKKMLLTGSVIFGGASVRTR